MVANEQSHKSSARISRLQPGLALGCKKHFLSNGPELFHTVIVSAFAIGAQQEIQTIIILLGRMSFPMTTDQFRAALAGLGISQAGFARIAQVNPRTVRRWCDGTRAVRGPVVALLERCRIWNALPCRAQPFLS